MTMPGSELRDDDQFTEKALTNTRADFREMDYIFRKKLDSMIPSPIAERVQEILRKRFTKEENPSETG
ncbi:MAG: hypothetical protein ACOX5R_16990 [bacterium]|jgi:hypothetical protein